jgi:hypothetical protein
MSTIERKVAERLLDAHRRSYEQTRNPIDAWRGYYECRTGDVPLPEWVLKYLDTVALTFCRWSTEHHEVPRDLHAAIASALGMNVPGRGNVFEQAKDNRAFMLALDVLRKRRNAERLKEHFKLYLAIEEVAQEQSAKGRRVSVSTVNRAWQKYQHLMDEIAPPRVFRKSQSF